MYTHIHTETDLYACLVVSILKHLHIYLAFSVIKKKRIKAVIQRVILINVGKSDRN